MKKLKFLSLILIIALAAAVFPVSAAALDDPSVSASAAVLMDADTGEVLYEKNGSGTIQPASTTKLMTALLVVEAIERGELDASEEVTAYEDCQYNMNEYSSNASPAIEPGEVMTVQDLLYCAMLVSANEACNILAERLSGSVSEFVSLMNQRAAELGCTGTHFANANGLQDADHYSTAMDFALIAKEALNHALLLEICGSTTHAVGATNMAEARSLQNTNRLLNPDSDYYYEYAYGLKTGYFTDAGYCLVSAANYNDMNIICVVMGSSEENGNFADSVTLYDWVFDNFSQQEILSSTGVVTTLTVEMGTTDSVDVRAASSVSVVLSNDYDADELNSHLNYSITWYNDSLQAPVNAGDVLGEVTVLLDGEERGTSDLVAASTVELSRVEYLRTQLDTLLQNSAVRKLVTLLIILLAIYILLVVFYCVQRVRHLRSVRAAKHDRAMAQAERETEWLDIPEQPDEDPEIDYFDEELPEERDTDSRHADVHDSYFDSFFQD